VVCQLLQTENAKGLVENNRNGFIVPIRDAEALKEKIEFYVIIKN